jgi:hypothetical protein
MTSNNDLHHYGVKGMRWGVRKKLASLRDRIRGRKKQATKTGKPLTKAVNEREREFQYRSAYLHRDRLSTKKIKAMNERLKLEDEFDKNTRKKAEERQKTATEERARKAKARAKMIDGAINVIKNTPIENLVTYDKERYRTDNKYKNEVDDKIEGIKSVRALIGGLSGTASILSQSDDGGVYIGRDEMEREREVLLHAALLENEEVLLHGRKWSEEAKARVRQARKSGVSVYDMFSSFYKNAKKRGTKFVNDGVGVAEDAANKSAHFLDGLYESKSEKKTKRRQGRKLTKGEFGVIDIDKAMKADKFLSRYEKDYMRRPGYLDKQVKPYRKEMDGHKKALAGRPDNGRYSRKTSQDITDYHYKPIKDAAYDDYQKERKKYVEEKVNPKKRFKFGRLK